MELTKHNIRLSNALRKDIKPIEVQAAVNTDMLHLCIPKSVAKQLELKELEKRELILADGSQTIISYVGPVMVKFRNRICFAGALVMGDAILLGTILMDDKD